MEASELPSAALEVQAGGIPLELSEPFDPSVYYYEVLADRRAWVDVVPSFGGAVTVNGQPAADGQPLAVPLRIGETDILVDSGEDQYSVKAYRSPFESTVVDRTPSVDIVLDTPRGLALDSDGNVIVTDSYSETVTKYSSTGEVEWTFPNEGSGGFAFEDLGEVAVDGLGNVYVVDDRTEGTDRIVKLDADGNQIMSYPVDDPRAIEVDANGNVYAIASIWVEGDYYEYRLAKLDGDNDPQTMAWTWPSNEGLYAPFLLALDKDGNIGILDEYYNEWESRFHKVVTVSAANGTETESTVELDAWGLYPSDLESTADGEWIVTDDGTGEIHFFDGTGAFLDSWGNGTFAPQSVSVTSNFERGVSGELWVTDYDDSENAAVVALNHTGAMRSVWASGGAWHGTFSHPTDVTVDSLGNVYVADSGNHRVEKYDASGTWVKSFVALDEDGNFEPDSVAVDDSGDVYVVDSTNWRIVRFDSTGAVIGELTGLARQPFGIAYDPFGDSIYVSYGPVTSFDPGMGVIERYTTELVDTQTSWASEYSWETDYYRSVAVDADGYVYGADTDSVQVYYFDGDPYGDPFGGVTEAAGDEYSEIDYIGGIAVGGGYVFVGDLTKERVQAYTREGEFLDRISEFPPGGYISPRGVAVLPDGDLYVTDNLGHKVFRVDLEFTNGLRGLDVFGATLVTPFYPEHDAYEVRVQAGAEGVGIIPLPSDPGSSIKADREPVLWGEPIPLPWPLDDGTIELEVTNQNEDTAVYRIDLVVVDTLREVEPGSYVSFGDRTWVTTGTAPNKLLSIDNFGAAALWDPALLPEDEPQVDDPLLRFRPTAEGSIAESLNTDFLDSIDGESGLKQWLVPMDIPVNSLFLDSSSVVTESSSPLYSVKAKAALLTYGEYRAMTEQGLLSPGEDGSDTWHLMNPMTGTSYVEAYVAHVQNDAAGSVYFLHAAHAVRPVVQLQPNVLIGIGDGTEAYPYTLELPWETFESLEADQDDRSPGANTGLTVTFSPVRSLPKDDPVTVTFPEEFYTAEIPETGAITVSVDGEPVDGVTYVFDTLTRTATIPLPTDVEYGQAVTIVFTPAANIKNPEVETTYSLLVGLPTIDPEPVGATLLVAEPEGYADLIVEGQPTGDGDFLAGQTREFAIAVSNVGTTSAEGEVSVTVSPSSFAEVTLEGDGWTCEGLSCSRLGTLEPEGAFEPIVATLTVPETLSGETGVLQAWVSAESDAVT
ncbi:MAG TPA: NHL repeat-containing protein, partial [Paenibacillus sp.]|nr:NHL repeat-containing protein [Paenibacillus sp.]